MGNFIEKERKVIEAITFNELVEYGKANGANIVEGMPRSFEFKDHKVTHENDQCYLIQVIKDGEGVIQFTPNDMLIVNKEEDQLIPYSTEKFNAAYEPV